MNILLTGANGFIGRYIIEKLNGGKNKIFAICHHMQKSGLNTKGSLKHIRFYYADLSDGVPISSDIDVIVHTAARSPGHGVTLDEYISSNIIATQNLIEFAIRKRTKSFIYLSAISVYGRIESTIVDEDTPLKTFTPYGMTKYIAELLLKEKKDVISSIIFRLPIVVGAGMKSGWLFNIYETLLKGEPVRIYNGNSPYNMVHLSDIYNLILSSFRYKFADNSVFTVSCKEFIAVREIVDIMKEYIQSKSEIIEGSSTSKGFIISTEKARRILGFQPKSAREIVSKFLEEMTE